LNVREKLLNYFHQRDRGWTLSLFAVVCLIYLPFLDNPFVFDDRNFFNGVASEYYAHSTFNFDLRWFAYATLGWTAAIFSDVLPHPFRLGNILLHVANSILLFYVLRQIISDYPPSKTSDKTSPPPARGRARVGVERLILHDFTPIPTFPLKGEGVAHPIPASPLLGGKSKPSSAIVWGAFLGALVFAVHPVAVYAVGYVVQRSILMATFFSLLMLFAYMRGLLSGQKRWLVLAVVAYFLAGFSKEHSVLMPAVLVVWTMLWRVNNQVGITKVSSFPRRRESSLMKELDSRLRGNDESSDDEAEDLRVVRVSKLVFICTWLAFIAIGILLVLRAKGVLGTPYEVMAGALFEQQGIVENTTMLHCLSALTQAGLFFKYLLLWIIPNPAWMSIDMREPFVADLNAWQGWLGAGAFIAYGIFALWLLLRGGNKGLVGFALLYPWLLFMVELTSIRVQEPFVLYRSYLWMPGLMIFISLLLQKLWEVNFSQRRAVMVAGLIILLLLPLAWNRLWVFADNYRLWNEAAGLLPSEQSAGADRIFYNRAQALGAMQKWDEAAKDYEKVVTISPQLFQVRQALGMAYFNVARYQDAISQFDAGIALKPDDGRLYFGKAQTLMRLKSPEAAQLNLKKACELKEPIACMIVGLSAIKK